MEIAVLGIDLDNTTCSVAGLDRNGAIVLRKRVRRHRLQAFLSELPPCIVAMEACGGAHHVGHFCVARGHEPRLMSPLYLRPYVKVHKTDDRDAEAIAEAATRPTMSFVTLKRPEQLDLQALHRARERLVQNRIRPPSSSTSITSEVSTTSCVALQRMNESEACSRHKDRGHGIPALEATAGPSNTPELPHGIIAPARPCGGLLHARR